MGFHFFELKKLPEAVSGEDPLLLWLSLFKAETAEELKKIKETGVSTMEQAINAYYNITASPKFLEIQRLREKAGHDEAQALRHAKQEGLQKGMQEGMQKRNIEIARNLMEVGMPLHQIAAATGLTLEELENCK